VWTCFSFFSPILYCIVIISRFDWKFVKLAKLQEIETNDHLKPLAYCASKAYYELAS